VIRRIRTPVIREAHGQGAYRLWRYRYGTITFYFGFTYQETVQDDISQHALPGMK
jgi:hypothetical protein